MLQTQLVIEKKKHAGEAEAHPVFQKAHYVTLAGTPTMQCGGNWQVSCETLSLLI